MVLSQSQGERLLDTNFLGLSWIVDVVDGTPVIRGYISPPNEQGLLNLDDRPGVEIPVKELIFSEKLGVWTERLHLE